MLPADVSIVTVGLNRQIPDLSSRWSYTEQVRGKVIKKKLTQGINHKKSLNLLVKQVKMTICATKHPVAQT